MKSYTDTQGTSEYMVFEFDSKEQIDQVASGMLSNNTIDGLLPFVINQFNNKIITKFNITSMITLSELLEEYICKNQIIKIIDTIINLFTEVEDYLIDPDSLILDTDKMFYNKETQNIYLITMPVINKNIGNPPLDVFFKSLICRIKFDQSENCDYIGKMLGYLNSDTKFSLHDFKYIIDEQKTRSYIEGEIESINNDQPRFILTKPQEKDKEIKVTNKDDEENRNDVGFKIPLDFYADDDHDEEMQNKKSIFSKIFKEQKSRKSKKKEIEDVSDDSIKVQVYNKQGDVASESAVSPNMFVFKNIKADQKSFLLRLKNNEKIYLGKNVFKIGTDKKIVDYYISDNNAVSRTHADIVSKEDAYFIIDNNSTNHTYLNEHMIKSLSEMKLQDKSRIRLANEEFIFYLSDRKSVV